MSIVSRLMHCSLLDGFAKCDVISGQNQEKTKISHLQSTVTQNYKRNSVLKFLSQNAINFFLSYALQPTPCIDSMFMPVF